MKWLLYLTILGIFVSGINSHRLIRQTSESEDENEVESPEEVEEAEEMEMSENEEVEPTEAQEMEESENEEVEPTEPAEFEEPEEVEAESEVGTALSSSIPVGENAIPGEQAVVQSSSVLILEENSSEEDVGLEGGAINQNSELAGGDSNEVEGGIGGGAGLGGVPISSEEDNTIGAEPIPTEIIAATVVYRSTGNPIREATPTLRFENRGDAFFADFGPQEGAKNELGTEDGESSTSSPNIGVIVGATSAGTVAVVAGLAIAYVKLKGAAAADAA